MPAPFHPTRAFQAYQIFAANTDVGKTILATGLCRAAALTAKQKNRDVFYLKPVQTGYPVDSDERHVKTYSSGVVQTETLYKYADPVSPHIATDKPPHDDELMSKTKQSLLNCVRQSRTKNGAYAFVETAGGIHSPVMSGTPQADFYRPLRLPSVLIGDSKLGGISTTLSTYESLALRGYDIPSILLFHNGRYRNHEMLATQLDGRTLVSAVPAPPTKLDDPIKEAESMMTYYAQLDEHMAPVIKHLDKVHEARFERLAQMEEKAKDILWWPFTQHQNVKQTTVVDSAYKDYFLTYQKSTETNEMEPKEMFDSCASWWTQGLGHANPQLTLAAARAAGRYGHVMFPETANEPAMSLAERILAKDTWASRVFFSDNGSTAIEVAIKMALRATAIRYGWSDSKPVDVLGLEGGYHGDTIGAMDACSPNVFNKNVQWYKPKGHWLQAPSIHISKGKVHVRVPDAIASKGGGTSSAAYASLDAVYATDKRGADPLANVYKTYIRSQLQGLRDQGRHIGALLMEPVIMGSGGMIFVDPLFQRVLVDTVRAEGADLLGYKAQEQAKGWQGVPVIFDEIFAGWYRLGRRSASDFLGVKPDIVGYAKTLTGGLVPLALTVTKESLFDIFLSDKKEECLLHGHSYTAHPIGCSVAGETIDTLERMARVDKPTEWTSYRDNWSSNDTWSMWSPATVDRLSHMDKVESVMSLGSILAVELKDTEGGYNSMISKNIIQKMRHGDFDEGNGAGINLFARPLGNVIYLMTSQITTPDRVRKCEDILFECLEQKL
ncbi:hypothetical protein BDB00DRAFT_807931 [Zychaea mexicana]|uniref:uncharacterized protein n=1 Tax=Zychaea mexicana TaxID=64656 RepID=UPI0022FEBD75|nr:uncharacterized protein BDB00DRAFT_807931 [Zychaea mexicana]KAI9496590.1 hypothetical protein BDB00DRAFT_807931 [Zychaea mexicana]